MRYRSCAIVTLASTLAAPSALAQFAGRVVDMRQTPLYGVEVQFVVEDSVRSSAQTDSAGQFSLREATAAGSLRFRKFGYRPRSVRADPGKALEVILDEMPADIEGIRVVGQLDASKGRLAEFYAHRAKAQFGVFLDRAAIEKEHPQTLSDLMLRVPGARRVALRGTGSGVRLRGCQPLVWLDGIRLPGTELDEAARVHDIDAMEVYPSPAGVPAAYTDRRNNCGTILLWTRAH